MPDTELPQPVLNWQEMDIEQRLGFRGGRNTDTNSGLTFGIGLLLTLVFYGLLMLSRHSYLSTLFLDRGITPYFTAFFGYWALAILFLKSRKLKLQQRALDLELVPRTADFVLAPATAPDILEHMGRMVDNPRHFVLMNRIERALSNLRNIGMIADVAEILRTQAENDEDSMDSSYALVRGFIWAIPVLGFIGTVLGLSQAIGTFGAVLAGSNVIEQLKGSLQDVTKGLSVAFDTTLVALVFALIIQLLLTALKKREERFLDDCKDYCHAHIISRLRLLPLREDSKP